MSQFGLPLFVARRIQKRLQRSQLRGQGRHLFVQQRNATLPVLGQALLVGQGLFRRGQQRRLAFDLGQGLLGLGRGLIARGLGCGQKGQGLLGPLAAFLQRQGHGGQFGIGLLQTLAQILVEIIELLHLQLPPGAPPLAACGSDGHQYHDDGDHQGQGFRQKAGVLAKKLHGSPSDNAPAPRRQRLKHKAQRLTGQARQCCKIAIQTIQTSVCFFVDSPRASPYPRGTFNVPGSIRTWAASF